jgi:hypothetical protein
MALMTYSSSEEEQLPIEPPIYTDTHEYTELAARRLIDAIGVS